MLQFSFTLYLSSLAAAQVFMGTNDCSLQDRMRGLCGQGARQNLPKQRESRPEFVTDVKDIWQAQNHGHATFRPPQPSNEAWANNGAWAN